MLSHIVIESVTPMVDCGRYPAKGIVGEPCAVEADIFRDGHSLLRAAVKWRRKEDEAFNEAPMAPLENDRWGGEFVPAENARYVFTIEAWTDLFASWLAPKNASLAFALTFVLFWFGILYVLYRKKIVFKV